MTMTLQQQACLPTQRSFHPPYANTLLGSLDWSLFQTAVNGEHHTMERPWANSLTALSPGMGTGDLMEGLTLGREEAQPLVICATLLILTGSSPNSPAGTHIEALHALGLVPARFV